MSVDNSTRRMDKEANEPELNPALLGAILSDPVLLQAVDPRVLQEVLVHAAAANLRRGDASTATSPPPPPAIPTPVPVFNTPKLGSQFTPVHTPQAKKFGAPFQGFQQDRNPSTPIIPNDPIASDTELTEEFEDFGGNTLKTRLF